MSRPGDCPECGAGNAADARRCRICGHLLNPAIPEVDPKDRELPEHVRRAMEREWSGATKPVERETYIPGYTSEPPPPPADHSHLPPPPAPAAPAGPAAPPTYAHLPPPPPAAGFEDKPPPPAAAAPIEAPPVPAAPPAPPSPTATAEHAGEHAGEVDVPWSAGVVDDQDEADAAFDIVIEARPRYDGIPVFEPPPREEIDDDVFDPDALFRDIAPMPAMPPPPHERPARDPDEIVLPPIERGPDPLWSIGEGRGDLTTAEIERLTREALREERLKRRPGFLDKVLRPEDEADEGEPPRN